MSYIENNVQRDHKNPFVYMGTENLNLSPYQFFLKYTDEKKITSNYVESRLKQLTVNLDAIQILDIGCGNGDLILEILKNANLHTTKVTVTGVDPNAMLLKEFQKSIQPAVSGSFIFQNVPFEKYNPENQQFDLIIASNLYHLSDQDYVEFIRKARNMLSSKGELLFIYRSGKDDSITEFRLKFEPLLYKNYRPPRNMEDVRKALELAGLNYNKIDTITSQVKFPRNIVNQNKLLEFIFNLSIKELPVNVHQHIQSYLSEHGFQLTSRQDIMIIKPGNI